jgi:hypothetical protein
VLLHDRGRSPLKLVQIFSLGSLRMLEVILRSLNATLRPLFLLFDRLEHRLDTLIVAHVHADLRRVGHLNLLVTFVELSLLELFLRLFHEFLEELLSIFLALFTEVLFNEFVQAAISGAFVSHQACLSF